MNRLFGSFFDGPTAGGAGNGGAIRQWMPAMDLVETKDHFVLRADLPGLTEKDVTVELEENVLSVSGERRAETTEEREGYYRIERASGRFARSLTLPEGVDPAGISAEFHDGVLEVRVPKPAERKPQRVAIDVSRGGGDVVEHGDQPISAEASRAA
jgi:HSP20 family protein